MSKLQRGSLALLVSELMANAVCHSQSDAGILLSLAVSDDHVRIDVTDSGGGFARHPAAMTRPGAGYGLFLVEQLTPRWGMTRNGGKTTVWFELDCTESPTQLAL